MATKEDVELLIKGAEKTEQLLKILTEKTSALQQETAELRKIVVLQNESIIAMLKKQQSLMVSKHLTSSADQPTCASRFPLRSQDDLDKFEEELNESNIEGYVKALKLILPTDKIAKNLTRVLSMELILDYNIDGLQKKKRLQNHTKFMDLLYRATFRDDWDYKQFLDELRRALRVTKNRHFKTVCVSKRNMKIENGNLTLQSPKILNTKDRNKSIDLYDVKIEEPNVFEQIFF